MKIIQTTTFVILVAIVFTTEAISQSIERFIRFEPIGLQKQISHKFSESIAFDKDGTLWIGTQDGLNKYTGFTVETYSTLQQQNSISDNYILKVFSSSSGDLLIGHRNGVDIYNAEEKNFKPLILQGVQPEKFRDVNGIAQQSQQWLWFTTRKEGVYKLDSSTKKVNHYPFESVILDILIDQKENVWIATAGNGLFMYSKTTDRFEQIAQDFNNEGYFSTVSQISPDTYLAGSKDSAIIFNYPSVTSKPIQPIQHLTCPGRVSDSLATASGLWVTTTSSVCFYKKNAQHIYQTVFTTQKFGLVTNIVEDKYNNVWLSTSNGTYFNTATNTPLQHYVISSKKQEQDIVTSFAKLPNKQLIIGTWNSGLLSQSKPKFTLPFEAHVLTLMTDLQGQLWVGTFDKGVFKYDSNGNFLKHINLSVNDEVNHYAINKLLPFKSNIIAATFGGGLFLYDQTEQQFTSIQPKEITSGNITSIVALNETDLIVSTYDSGIFYISNFATKQQTVKPVKLPSKRIMGLTLHDNTLYIATQDIGLLILNDPQIFEQGKTPRVINSLNANIASNSLYGTLVDAQNNIWISHSRGLSVIEFKQQNIVNFSLQDGLQDTDFTAGSYFKDEQGLLYFGGSNGFNQINPDEHLIKAQPEPVIRATINTLNSKTRKQFSKIKNQNGSIQLSHLEGAEIELFTDNLAFVDDDLFQYKWNVNSDSWTSFGNTNRLVIPSLSSGSHKLMLTIRTSEITDPDEILEIEFAVQPPFWKTPKAYLLYIFIALTIFIIVEKRKRSKIKKQEAYKRKLETTVNIRTKELNSAINQLKEIQQQTELESYTDYLTGLYNRRFFQAYLCNKKSEVQRFIYEGVDTRLGIILIDIDHFKSINDDHGHDIGDKVIAAFSEGIKHAIRANDISVRWGGEEFLVVGYFDAAADIQALIKRVYQSIQQTIKSSPEINQLKVTCSMGSFYWPLDSIEIDAWSFEDSFKIADQALFFAKESGRDNVACIIKDENISQSDSQEEFETLTQQNKLLINQTFFNSPERE